jgi:hypothetical protein
MALPQNPLSDRQLFETLSTQNDNLSAQTKVLHRLSDNITDQRKDFAALRKDIQAAQKELLSGKNKGMSEIQKYFAKYKSDNSSSKVRDKDQSTGFFKGIINKIFGPSKYQQKMIDEITRTRELTESTALDINFIRKQNEEGPRARERELLAQLIADKINANNNNASTDDKGSSILGTLGKFGAVLVGGLGTLLSALGATILTGLGGLRFLLSGIATLLETYFASKILGRAGGGSTAGVPPTSPGSTTTPDQKRIPGKETPQIEGQSKPKDMGTLKQGRGGVYVPEGSSLGSKLGGAMSMLGKGLIGASMLYGVLGNPDEEKETLDKNKQNGGGGPLKWDDPSNPLTRIKKFFTDPFKSEEEKRKGEQADVRKIDNAIEAKLKEPVTDFNSAMKAVITGLMGLEDKLEEAADSVYESTQKFLEPKLNKLGELDFGNGQTLNLLPNLGTAAFATLKEVWDETKDLAKEASNATGDVINNVITQNMKETAAQLAPVAMDSIWVAGAQKAFSMRNPIK